MSLALIAAVLDTSVTPYAPTLAGTALPAPNSYSRKREDVFGVTTLAGGREVRYVRGFRYVYALGWSRLRGPDVTALRAASLGFAAVPFLTLDGDVVTVYVASPPDEDPVAGTNPLRYAVSIELREPGIRSPFGAASG